MAANQRSSIHVCHCPDCQHHPRGRTAHLHGTINRFLSTLDEKSRRRFAGLWASRLGYGGVQQLARVTGLSRDTITRGRDELKRADPNPDRIRAPGAGRPCVEKKVQSSQPP
jgi:hypothetical protein